MSFILDALRKSESERQRDAAPTLTRAAYAPPPDRSRRTWLVIALPALVLIAVGAAAWLVILDDDALPAIAVQDQATATQPTPATSGTLAEAPAQIEEQVQPGTRTDSAAPVQSDPDAPPRSISQLLAANPSLPEPALEFVTYNGDDPARSSAWINGRRHVAGDTIGNGVTLVEIRQNSVVLRYESEEFLLRL